VLHDSPEAYGPLPEKSVKVVVCGAPTVGKTQLIHNFSKQDYRVGGDLPKRMEEQVAFVMDRSGKKVEISLWDASGDEERMLKSTCDVFILCFAVDNKESFHRLKSYAKRIKGARFIVVATKADLREENSDCISTEQGSNAAHNLGAWVYAESFADEQEAVEAVFQYAARTMAQ